MARRGLPTQVATGAIIVIIGILLLLSTTDTLDVGSLWRYVPSLFVLLGVWALIRSEFRNVTGPIILIIIAGTVQLLALDLITGRTIATWWPVLIILFGFSVMTGYWRQRRRVSTTSGDDIDLIGIFGGTERRVDSTSFTGGTATAIFGGVDVDLRDAAIAEPPAVETATALFGGVEVRVPEDWTVSVDALPIFGAVEDERGRRPDIKRSAEPDLVLNGFVAFGGISIGD